MSMIENLNKTGFESGLHWLTLEILISIITGLFESKQIPEAWELWTYAFLNVQ